MTNPVLDLSLDEDTLRAAVSKRMDEADTISDSAVRHRHWIITDALDTQVARGENLRAVEIVQDELVQWHRCRATTRNAYAQYKREMRRANMPRTIATIVMLLVALALITSVLHALVPAVPALPSLDLASVRHTLDDVVNAVING